MVPASACPVVVTGWLRLIQIKYAGRVIAEPAPHPTLLVPESGPA